MQQRLWGDRVVECRARAENDLFPVVGDLIAQIENHSPRLFWICSPNNPTGSWLDDQSVQALAESCCRSGTILVIDEAYRCFVPAGLLPEKFYNRAIYLRSMTKDFYIPGLRLGWVKAHQDIIERSLRRQPDWSVNSAPAQDAGVACLNRLDYFEQSRDTVRREVKWVGKALSGMGLKVYPTAGNFLLVRIGNDAQVKRLQDHLILVRVCASFGLEGCILIGIRNREDNETLLGKLENALR